MNNNDLLIKIGECCRRAREDDHITQKQMAVYCGVCQQNISKFEAGLNNNCSILFRYMAICDHYRDLMDLLMKIRSEVLSDGQTD